MLYIEFFFFKFPRMQRLSCDSNIQYMHHEMLFFTLSYNVFVCFLVVIHEEEEQDIPPNVKIFKSSHMSAKLTYKENYVPYSTRFLELFRPKADDASGSQNNEK